MFKSLTFCLAGVRQLLLSHLLQFHMRSARVSLMTRFSTLCTFYSHVHYATVLNNHYTRRKQQCSGSVRARHVAAAGEAYEDLILSLQHWRLCNCRGSHGQINFVIFAALKYYIYP